MLRNHFQRAAIITSALTKKSDESEKSVGNKHIIR